MKGKSFGCCPKTGRQRFRARGVRRLSGLLGLFAASANLALAAGEPRTETTGDRPDRLVITGRALGINAVESEHDLVGPNEQPEWTTRRVFAETDVYVIPPGDFEINQFYISSHPRHGVPQNLFKNEFEVGLPWRTQFDLELDYSVHHGGKLRYDGTLVELPHALAKWGRIPLNPTVDFGWRFTTQAPDAYFFRLLLAEEFSKRLHLGANLTFDRQIGGPRQTAFEFNHALSYALIDSKLSVGYELRVEYEREQAEGEKAAAAVNLLAGGATAGSDENPTDASRLGSRRHGRFTHSTTVLLGPSVLYRPTRSTYLSLVPLVGLTHQSPVAEVYCVFGIDLGPRGPSEQGEGQAEAERVPSMRRRR